MGSMYINITHWTLNQCLTHLLFALLAMTSHFDVRVGMGDAKMLLLINYYYYFIIFKDLDFFFFVFF